MDKRNVSKYPYYIVAPPYTRTSAGVRVLYKLCDMINKKGYSAYIFQLPYLSYDISSSPCYVAPLLNKKIIDYHFNNKMTPIIIYPETIQIDKLSSPYSVQYFLNYTNNLDKNLFGYDDYLLAYSSNILKKIKKLNLSSKLNIIVSDPDFYCYPSSRTVRSGSVFYAGKYKYNYGGKLSAVTDGMIEITKDKKDSQSPEEIRDLFQKSELFYSYEDSSLNLEAMLCGCPVVLIPNEFYKETLAKKELNGLGYAWGNSPQEIAHAKSTVKLVRKRFFYLMNQTDIDLDIFLKNTQQQVSMKKYKKPFADKIIKSPSYVYYVFSYFMFIKEVIKQNGIIKTFNIIFNRIRKGRISIY